MKKFSILTLMVVLLSLGSILLLGKQKVMLLTIQNQCKDWGVSELWEKYTRAGNQKSKANHSLTKSVVTSVDADNAVVQAADQQQAASLIYAAEQKLKEYHAVEAQLQQVIFMHGMKYQGHGTYLQSGIKRLKLNIHLQAGASTGDLLQVSDGQLLWTEYRRGPIPADLPEDQLPHYFRVERRNLGRIEERLKQLSDEYQAQQVWDLGTGGLCALLALFRENLEFTLGEPQAIQGIPCYVLTGHPNKTSIELAKFMQRKRQYIASGSVPTKVVLYLEQAQLFPLRYEYYRVDENDKTSPMLQIEFSRVIFNGSPDLRAFTYNPPQGYFPHDVTRDFLKRIETTQSVDPQHSSLK